MIFELYQWLRTPCSPLARRLGYLGEAIAVEARHRRHRSAWEPHLAACRAIIGRAADACGHRRRVAVLGSGALLDIPLDDLAAKFQQVELIDMVHPRRARQRARLFPNVTLREADLTGLAARLLPGGRPPRPGPPIALSDDTDLVVSANLLSQLAVLPGAWLLKRRRIGEAERLSLSRDLLAAHLDWLASVPAQVCLVTEVERAYFDPSGARVQGWDALFGLPLPPAEAVWAWDIGRGGETAESLMQRNTIHGYSDLAAASTVAGGAGLTSRGTSPKLDFRTGMNGPGALLDRA